MAKKKHSSQTQNIQKRNQGNSNTSSVSTENTNSKENNIILTTFNQAAIIVLVFTALTYAYAALFKYGYHSYYDLTDYSLLKIDTSDLTRYFLEIFPWLATTLTIYILARYVFLIPELLLKRKGVKSKIILSLMILFFISPLIGWVFIIDIYSNWYISIWCIIYVFTLAYYFLPPILQKYIQVVLSPFKTIAIIVFNLVLGFISFRLGAESAERQRRYLIFNQNNQDQIVISSSGNYLITAPFNKDKGTIEPTFYAMSIKNQIILKTKKLSKALKVSSVYK
ncbi:hypothetical protein SPE26_24565 [Bacillus thuringiensis]|uniref:Uncharacterized protein n=1 Tax=Bacillus thuringiensis TaxID=1428 RepID=A0AAW9GIZ6_BACTU|nr:hypothetical protein [Bacillus thuringiensis]MDY0853904.1 hypothetical protein [Bacillus thuringiensis]MDY4393868.1 hypothetical protein [Bacillus thuringiensis]MDY7962638.1 hypothetical protein [Bacillus thuringiensis]